MVQKKPFSRTATIILCWMPIYLQSYRMLYHGFYRSITKSACVHSCLLLLHEVNQVAQTKSCCLSTQISPGRQSTKPIIKSLSIWVWSKWVCNDYGSVKTKACHLVPSSQSFRQDVLPKITRFYCQKGRRTWLLDSERWNHGRFFTFSIKKQKYSSQPKVPILIKFFL